ncbi:MAG: type VI secretion system baseplate subunit TssK [Polyangiaceae bacterium]
MKKVPHSTSRVLWQMGQALLPEHFFAQEESLREEMSLRIRLQRPLSWGVGSLEWDGFEIPKGVVSITELSLMLPSGTLIDIPGNTAPAMLNLKAAGNQATVWVHLQSGFEKIHVGGRGELAEENIERILQKVELSTNSFSETGAQSFKLASFDCRPDGVWELNTSYIPPLLAVGTSPFFESIRARIESVIRMLRTVLLSEVQENYLAASSNSSGRIALRGLFALQALLVDLKAGIQCHPYDLFQALRSLYIDVCVHRDVLPGEIEKPYRHDDIAATFEPILERLEEQAQAQRKARSRTPNSFAKTACFAVSWARIFAARKTFSCWCRNLR